MTGRPEPQAERGMQLLADWLVKRATHEENPGRSALPGVQAVRHLDDGSSVAPPAAEPTASTGAIPDDIDRAA